MIKSPTHRRRDTRAQILDTAGEVFLREGFARTSIDMIASTAHLSKQSIYEHFPNKLALFEAAVRRTLEEADKNFSSVQTSENVRDTLIAFGHRLFERYTHPASFGLFRANIVAASQFPELAAELHEYRLSLAGNLASYLDRLIHEGKLAPVDPAIISTRFGALTVEGSRYFLGAPLPSTEERKTLVEAATDLFLHGYQRHSQDAASARLSLLEMAAKPVPEGRVALRLAKEKWDALLTAAMNEFLEHGYVSANMERIAKTVRSSKATIYRQFGNKEGLFRYIVEQQIFASSRATFEQPCKSDPLSEIAHLAQDVLEWHLEPHSIKLQRLLVQEAEMTPDLAQRFFDMRVAAVSRSLNRILARHDLPLPDIFAARAFYCLATHAVRFLTLNAFPDAGLREERSRECALIFLDGIARQ
ncbi:hypothetical protein MB02_12550 [Croceicoccus estronivorus]|uniref:TetR/AcrR family transcriptional regulator n=1 Tax=Croceicoccus estronivorus TaxID=1172626 RepID=UPI00082B9E96|nr:TetR/AcrR family transcriptional regulator [Croceicoccus estronivorus]OCC23436.1 hypothetical protein MB02_12550 [Croceicoccus estronivorus]